MSTELDKGTNPLKALRAAGQSVWLDFIQRSLITNGELQRLIEKDGVAGVTSNPAIFEKAIAGSEDYSTSIQQLAEKKMEPKAVYEHLAIQDIQEAADLFRGLYDDTKKRDGYVSLEVSPHLAGNTEGTLDEARRLWRAVNRPNVLIKVPGTVEGLPAIQTLIREGINVNITLLFSQARYLTVVEAYLKGLEARAADGADLSHVASVASFFISRIDTMVDRFLDDKLKTETSAATKNVILGLMGKVAIANGKQTYQQYKHMFSGPRWEALATKGANTQRVLWASTSTKNPKYRDVLYVEELIGPDTVNTIPPATLEVFRDHGGVRASLEEHLEAAQVTMDSLKGVGISMDEVTDKLLVEAVRLFSEPFDTLLETIKTKL